MITESSAGKMVIGDDREKNGYRKPLKDSSLGVFQFRLDTAKFIIKNIDTLNEKYLYLHTIAFNVVNNVVSFTVPRFGSNISITAKRTDNDGMTSNPYSYNFAREVDLSRAFKNTLVNLCGIPEATFDTYWDSNTGTYNSSISCINKGLTNTDLDTFIVLKNVKYDLNLYDNLLTNLSGLDNLVYVGQNLNLYNNNLNDISRLNSNLSVVNELKFTSSYLDTNEIVDYSPLDNMSINNLYINTINTIIEKKMSGTSSFCDDSDGDIDTLYVSYYNNNKRYNKYIICDYNGNYGQDDVDFLTTLRDKCMQKSDTKDYNQRFWDSGTGTFNSSINCTSKSLTDSDLDTFLPLKNVTIDVNLYDNLLTNLSGLDNLVYVGQNLNLYNNNLNDISRLNSNLSVVNELKFTYSYLDTNEIVDYSPLDNMSINNLYINTINTIIEKKMSGTSSFCDDSDGDIDTLYVSYYNNNKRYNKYIICDYNGNYGQDDVDFLTTLRDKCMQKSDTKDYNQRFWDSGTGTFNSSINCTSKSLTDSDLDTFLPLKNVTIDVNLYDNLLTNLSGLDNLVYVGQNLNIYNNNLNDISQLEGITSSSKTLRVDEKEYSQKLSSSSSICNSWSIKNEFNQDLDSNKVCQN